MGGDYCQLSGIFRVSLQDTPDTKRKALEQNKQYEALCGTK